ncbi:hypothetical protein ACFQ51_25885 [Streptomyces kaempferi]
MIAWLVRCLVWLTVNLMSLNSPRPATVTAEAAVLAAVAGGAAWATAR